jgi:hypothetical protein
MMAIGNSLDTIALLDFLDFDTRPTFILDATASVSSESRLTPVHCNPALLGADSGTLLEAITGKSTSNKLVFSQFRKWAIPLQGDTRDNHHAKQFPYCGFTWIKIVVEGQWSLISGSSNGGPGKSEIPGGHLNSDDVNGELQSSFDWTSDSPPTNMTPHVELARSIDWAKTSLGPMRTWSTQLRSTANLVMQDPRPAVLFWGLDVVMIYNEPYVELLADLHPACMGVSARVGFGDIWDHFEPIIERNLAGESVEETDTPIFLVRSGFLEEAYFSLKFMPVLDNNGATVGHYETVVESVRFFLASNAVCQR